MYFYARLYEQGQKVIYDFHKVIKQISISAPKTFIFLYEYMNIYITMNMITILFKIYSIIFSFASLFSIMLFKQQILFKPICLYCLSPFSAFLKSKFCHQNNVSRTQIEVMIFSSIHQTSKNFPDKSKKLENSYFSGHRKNK